MYLGFRLRLFDPAPVEGGNGTATDTTKTETPPASGSTTTTTTTKDGFEALAAKHSSDGIGLARNLFDQLQAANAKVAELTGKIAPDGAVILKGDQRKAWEKYIGLGKPEDLETKLTEGSAAVAKVTKFEREKHLGEVAKLAGFDPEVLATLAGDLELEIVDETVNGKTAKAAKVKVGDKSTALADYANANWKKFLPSLKLQAAPAGPKLGTPSGRLQGNQPIVTRTEGPNDGNGNGNGFGRPTLKFGGF